ncbi:Por secretion system C-terminal sorting domain-containing protein [Spirosomataceae bacterium TFI 002]|nr:Por secretion system C-terminal sorting domain-containing protein [Spirosomataceae bacterium TFI 002]
MRYTLAFLTLLYSLVGFGQANRWIDYTKGHLEISITQDGVYELNKDQLIKYGVLTEEINSKKPHLFHHGIEIPVSWNGNTLQFFAKNNKGQLDSLLYRPYTARPTRTHPLFQDAAIYYLSWNDEPIKAWTPKVNSAATVQGEASIINKKIVEYNDQYSFNNSIGLLPVLQQSYFEEGEGWTGKFWSLDTTATFSIELENFDKSAKEDIQIAFQLNGRSNRNHHVMYEINGVSQSDTLFFGPFSHFEKKVTLSPSSFTDNKLVVKFFALKVFELDWVSLSRIEIQYPGLDKDKDYEFFVLSNRSVVKTCESCILIEDVNSENAVEVGSQNGSYNLEKGKFYKYFKNVLAPESIKLMKFKELDRTANYFIVTHSSLLKSANEYAAYRSSESGGGYSVSVVTSEDLYKQFCYGERNPVAIKNYIQWACNGDFKGKQLLLLGRGVSFPDVLKQWRDRDLVPTVGYPGSDVLLSAGLDFDYDSDVQAISTGRLNVTKDIEVLNYLAKVKEIESAPIAADWKKNFAHLSGGKTVSEISVLSQTLKNISPYAIEGLLGADIETFVKKSTTEVEDIDIASQVNEGLGMIAFAGHGSANVIDLNIGYCSPLENGFNNKGQYPVMYFNGCGVGNVFYRYDPLTTDWLLTPEKGAIAVFSNSFWSYQFSTQLFLDAFYQRLFSDSTTANLSLGELHKEVNQSLKNIKFNPYVLSNIHQLVLQGDPAIKFFPVEKPDYQVEESSIFISSSNLSQPIAQNDQLNIGVVIKNTGRFDKSRVSKANITITSNNQTNNFEQVFNGFARRDTLSLTIPNTPIEKIAVAIIGGDEYSVDNNFAELVISNWEEVGSRTSFPANVVPDNIGPVVYFKVDNKLIENETYINPNGSQEITLVDENPISAKIDKIKVELIQPGMTSFEEISLKSVVSKTPYELSFTPDINLVKGTYTVRVTGFDENGNSSKQFVRTFLVNDRRMDSQLNIFPNPGSIVSVASLETIAPERPQNSSVSLYDLRGQVIQEFIWNIGVGKNEKEIKLSSIPPGIYYLKVILDWSDGTEELVKKLIVN